MKIWIITMEDPLYTMDFIKYIIKEKHQNIVGLTIAKGDRMKIGKKRSKIGYLFSLLLIMGPYYFVKNVSITLSFKIRKKLSKQFSFVKTSGLKPFAENFNIPVDFTNNPNSKDFITKLKEKEVDIIINQSQFIVKKDLLNVSKLGMLNRHNALLPKNRGRLTPFWVLFKEEKETGVSIHFVNEGIDAGDIIVQKRFSVNKSDTFNSLVRKNYEYAPQAMVEAINKLDKGFKDFIYNDDDIATYNTIPTLKEAWIYRKARVKKFFKRIIAE